MELLSVVVPCFEEQETIPLFYEELVKIADLLKDQVVLEVIFVDDGSEDDSLEEIKKLVNVDERIKYISFSRNFGKESAMLAGLKKAAGDYVAIMDVDLQDPPKLLPDMLHEIKNGYDCAATRRVTRKGEPAIRSVFARLFYKIINKISKTEIVDGARDYRMMTRQMVDAILSLPEYNRFSKGIFSWVGFKTTWLDYENIERVSGETKWSFLKLLMYSFDGIVAFSTAPLMLASLIGLIFCFLSFFAMIFFFVKTIIFGDDVQGFPALITVITFIGGIQLFCIGILGQYLSKTYLETKKRPLYIIKMSDCDVSEKKD